MKKTCGGYRYSHSKKSRTLHSIKKSAKGGAKRRVKKTIKRRRTMRKH